MYAMQVSQIEYISQPASPRLDFSKANKSNHPSPWEDFFKTSDPDINRARKACPLRELGRNRYGFLHTTMISYFANKQMEYEKAAEEIDEDLLVGARTEPPV